MSGRNHPYDPDAKDQPFVFTPVKTLPADPETKLYTLPASENILLLHLICYHL